MIDKAIERMKKGREERERRKRMLERTTNTEYMRFNFDKKSQGEISYQKKSPKNEAPILKMKVNVGNRSEEIFVYENDTADGLSKTFAESHSKITT